ncbi:MAG: hypothetical protein AAF639_39660 [Chloroflexota bacterium]
MFVKIQFQESIFSRLQRKATNLQISIEELIHRFVDMQLGDGAKMNGTQSNSAQALLQPLNEWEDDEWEDDDEWIEDEWDDEAVLNVQHPTHIRNDDEYWEQVYAELREIDPEHEAYIEHTYGTGIDLLNNTAGILGKGLPQGVVQYIVESPELSQQSLWSTSSQEK